MSRFTFPYPTALATMLAFALIGCRQGADSKGASKEGGVDVKKERKVSVPQVRISADTAVDHCSERGLQDRILFIVSQFCPKCKKARPVLERAVRGEGLELYYERIDLADPSGRERIEAYGISVQFVPTLLVDCQAYVGANHASRYGDIIREYKYGK